MKLNNKELEELLIIAEQCKIMIPKLTYNEELTKKILKCITKNEELDKDSIQKAYNNYLAQCLIGLNQCDSEVFKKLGDYMDNKF